MTCSHCWVCELVGLLDDIQSRVERKAWYLLQWTTAITMTCLGSDEMERFTTNVDRIREVAGRTACDVDPPLRITASSPRELWG